MPQSEPRFKVILSAAIVNCGDAAVEKFILGPRARVPFVRPTVEGQFPRPSAMALRGQLLVGTQKEIVAHFRGSIASCCKTAVAGPFVSAEEKPGLLQPWSGPEALQEAIDVQRSYGASHSLDAGTLVRTENAICSFAEANEQDTYGDLAYPKIENAKALQKALATWIEDQERNQSRTRS
jgi:hypothetical protein